MSWEDILKEKFEGPTPKSPKGSVDDKKDASKLLHQVNSGLETIDDLKEKMDVVYNILEIEGIDKLIKENHLRGFFSPDHFIKSIEGQIDLLKKNLEDLFEYFKGIHQYGAHAQERMDEYISSRKVNNPYWNRKTEGYRDKKSVWDDSSKLKERYRQKKRD